VLRASFEKIEQALEIHGQRRRPTRFLRRGRTPNMQIQPLRRCPAASKI